jgi:hypothetical protein
MFSQAAYPIIDVIFDAGAAQQQRRRVQQQRKRGALVLAYLPHSMGKINILRANFDHSIYIVASATASCGLILKNLSHYGRFAFPVPAQLQSHA